MTNHSLIAASAYSRLYFVISNYAYRASQGQLKNLDAAKDLIVLDVNELWTNDKVLDD